jgi:prevent-host-death family protein
LIDLPRATGVHDVESSYNSLVQQATISQLKNRLSAYLKKVRAGETILILDRDQPIAKIEPIRSEDDPDGRIAFLASQGILKPASKPIPLGLLKSIKPIRGSGVLQALLEERRQGR